LNVSATTTETASSPPTSTDERSFGMEDRASAPPTQQRVLWRKNVLLILLLSVCAGCSNRDPAAVNQDDSSDTARTVTERGPVKLTVEVSPAKPRLSDEPTLTVTIEAENGIDVESPPFGGSLGDFIIRDFYEPVPEVTADKQVIRQIYTLEPQSSGEMSVAPITVSFVDRRDSDQVTEHTISSDELTIEVTTIVGDAIPSLGELKPAAPPVALPEDNGLSSSWLALIGIVPLVAVLAWWWRRRRSPALTPEISPRERGLQELEELIRSGLAARDIKEFYVELTAVVRRYIERSSGIRAP
jgi:hypothetical protein